MGSDLEVSLGQVAPLCHKVRDAKHPPVSGAVPIICMQLSSQKKKGFFFLPAEVEFSWEEGLILSICVCRI